MGDSLTCPPHIAEALRRAGGENEYGEPNYRLVHPAVTRWPDNAGVRSGRLKYPKSARLRQDGWKGKDFLTGAVTSWPMSAQSPAIPNTIITPVYVYEDQPREEWVLEVWMPPEIACMGWEASRRRHRDSLKRGAVIDERFVDSAGWVDLLGEPPTRGEYRFLMYARDEHERPMAISDARLLDILQLSVRECEASGMADFRRQRLPENKSAQVVAPLQEERDREQRAIDDEYAAEFADIAQLVANQAMGLGRKYSLPNGLS
jgi:hypothetical protein